MKAILEFFRNVWTVITGGDFAFQYPCECQHGRGQHRRSDAGPGEIPERFECEACDCQRYVGRLPCSECNHGVEFHRRERFMTGYVRPSVCTMCPCAQYQVPPLPPVTIDGD